MEPYVIISITFLVIAPVHIYYWKQKKNCQRYPFYKLRNDVFIEIIDSNKSDEIQNLYRTINNVINSLHILNFNFFVDVNVEYIRGLTEDRLYGKKKNKPEKLHPLQQRFLSLIVQSARRNSILLRIAMNKYCRIILVLPIVFRFVKRHPSLYRKFQHEIETLQDYSRYSNNNHSGLAAA